MSLEASGGTLLELRGFGLCFGTRVVLAHVDLVLPVPGVDVLMGPVKSGKSSLVRALAGLQTHSRLARSWGEALLHGQPLAEADRPALVQQHAAHLGGSVRDALVAPARARRERSGQAWTAFANEALGAYGLEELRPRMSGSVFDLTAAQQRAVNILGHALAAPPLLMVDEPTYGLAESEADWLIAWLGALGRRTRLLVVLHHQGQARRLADRIVLLGGGRVLAHQSTQAFFAQPANAWVEQFVRTGSLAIASPGTNPDELSPDVEAPPPLSSAALAALAAIRQASAAAPEAGLPAPAAVAPMDPPAAQPFRAPASSALPVAARPGPSTAGPGLAPAPLAAPSAMPSVAPVAAISRPAPAPAAVADSATVAASAASAAAVDAAPAVRAATSASAAPAPASATPARSITAPTTRRAALPPVSRTGVEDAATVGRAILVDHRGPYGFHWVVPGKLAGCPEPGIVHDIDYDLDLLSRVGIQVLVTLTEHDLDQVSLTRHGLSNIHLPIFDREAPSLAQAYMLVRRMQKLMDEGKALAVHCKAGIGRTGTILAAWMIREGGFSSAGAIELLRNVNKSYVQSASQESFLQTFEADIVQRL